MIIDWMLDLTYWIATPTGFKVWLVTIALLVSVALWLGAKGMERLSRILGSMAVVCFVPLIAAIMVGPFLEFVDPITPYVPIERGTRV